MTSYFLNKKRGVERKKHWLFVAFLLFCLAILFYVNASENGICGENITWVLDKDGVLTISGNGSMENYDDDNKSPWYSDDRIRAVSIEPGINSIGNSAFRQCKNLTSIVIPDSVTLIDDSAFSGCKNLTRIGR